MFKHKAVAVEEVDNLQEVAMMDKMDLDIRRLPKEFEIKMSWAMRKVNKLQDDLKHLHEVTKAQLNQNDSKAHKHHQRFNDDDDDEGDD